MTIEGEWEAKREGGTGRRYDTGLKMGAGLLESGKEEGRDPTLEPPKGRQPCH